MEWPTNYATTGEQAFNAADALSKVLERDSWTRLKFYAKDLYEFALTYQDVQDAVLAYAHANRLGQKLNIVTAGRVLGHAATMNLPAFKEGEMLVLRKCKGYMNRTMFYLEKEGF